jgi:predicted secreted protein
MHWVVLGGAFAILWFLALLVVLPFGVLSADGVDDAAVVGADPGAPARTGLRLKFVIATAAAVVLWLVFYGLIVARVIDI